MSHLVENKINQQPIIATIRVNRFLQARTYKQYKNTTQVICNRYISLPDFKCDQIGIIFLKEHYISSGHYTSMISV